MLYSVIKQNSLLISVILIGAALLISVLLLFIRIVFTVWNKYKNKVIKNFIPVMKEYLQTGEHRNLKSHKKANYFKSKVIKKTIIKTSFGREPHEIDRLANLYRYLGYVEKDIKDARSFLWFVRAESARCLGQLRIEESKEVLRLLLKDRHVQVKLISAWALARTGDAQSLEKAMEELVEASKMAGLRLSSSVFELGKKAGPIVMKALKHDNDNVRILAVHLLGELKSERAVEPLINTALKQENNEIKIAVCKALGNIGSKKAESFLVDMLSHDNWVVRAKSVHALGKIGDPKEINNIVPLLNDEKWWVRYNAGKALFLLGAPGKKALKAEAEKQGHSRDMALQWLSECREQY
ncbi:MAG: HEAT repeat domain-containing protein [Elusimicrobiota bacterium]